MKIWHIFARPAAVLTAAAAIWSCGLFDGTGKHDEINYLPDYVYTEDDRAILGTTKEIRIGQVLISPEIYVGEQKMDISVRQEDTESGTVTVISVHFPDTITDEMYSGGIEGQYCRLVLKSEVEGMEGTYNDIIAWIRLYEKTGEFIDGMTVGNPVTAETDGAYCIYLNDSDEDNMPWVTHDNSYHTPMKIAGENPERLTFLDEDGNTLQDVNMRYISTVSEKYIYAELEYPVSIDTSYTDYESTLGLVSQQIGFGYKEVLIGMSDGKLLEMPWKPSSEEVEHNGVICQWLSDDLFYFSESVGYGEPMPRIRRYKIEEDGIREDFSYPTGEYPDNISTFSWTGNEKDGIIINEVNFYSFEESRLNTNDLYYERFNPTSGASYNERIIDGYYILKPFVAADGCFYTIIADRRYITGTYLVTPRLYRMEKEPIFKFVADLGDEDDNLTEYDFIQARHAGNSYILWSGGYCRIDASGNITMTEDPDLSISEAFHTKGQYWPYTTGYIYYAEEDDPDFHVLNLEDMTCGTVDLDVDISWTADWAGNVTVFMENSNDPACRIVVDGALKFSSTLKGLDAFPVSRSWAVISDMD